MWKTVKALFKEVGSFIKNPELFVDGKMESLVASLQSFSYWICLYIAIVGILFYVTGKKESISVTYISIISYVLINIFISII